MPRQILPGSTYLVSRRTSQRQFFLRPSALTNQIFAYCLALAADKTGVIVHAFCLMSDHWHGVLTDPFGRVPEFLEHLHKLVAKSMNASLGRWENFWSPDPPSIVRLEDDEAVPAKIVYTLENPVEAGLVSHGDRWPGLRSSARAVAWGATRVVRRPKVFFREKGRLPKTIELKVTPPHIFPELSKAQRADRIQRAVEGRERELRQEAALQGRTFQGPVAVRKVNPFDSPKTREPRRELSPRVASSERGARVSAIRRIQAFICEYRDAFRKWQAGVRDVLFPFGTYALRILARVACAVPPS